MKRLPIISVLCFALMAAAWAIDLLTPQLFVAAILLNGPIALAGLAMNTALTTALVVFAEVANIVAGYANGAQAHYHWDSLAIGNRVLLALSFLLVGYLTARAQEYAREAGSATERARISAEDKALRRAVETVRSSLNVDLVLRAIVAQAIELLDADQAMLVVRRSQLAPPDVYGVRRGTADVSMERRSLDSGMSTLVERIADEILLSVAPQDDPVVSMVLEAQGSSAVAGAHIASAEYAVTLFVFGDQFSERARPLLRGFSEGASVALEQARLFMQLGYRNEEIAAQKNALEDRNRVIRDIVYALAHDLRTPLAAANVTLKQALEGAYGTIPEQYREVVRAALASNADQRGLVDTLLLVARFESGESSTLRESIDVAAEAQRVLAELRPIGDLRNVHLGIACADARVTGDSSELRRAISNLIANAIAATPEGGRVDVRIVVEPEITRVIVEDQGYGIQPEQQKGLFQRFAVDARAPGSGTGLGLYIVRLIAEKFGGTVTYAPGSDRGSIFTLLLPRAVGASKRA